MNTDDTCRRLYIMLILSNVNQETNMYSKYNFVGIFIIQHYYFIFICH